MRIAVLGSTGMLGSTVTKFLSKEAFEVLEYNRAGRPIHVGNSAKFLDVTDEKSIAEFLDTTSFDYVVNGIGLIKQLINEESEEDANYAYLVNSKFQEILNEYSRNTSTPIIQIGTDCVYSGNEGSYNEKSKFDCSDIYGLSKVEGEKRSKRLMILRSSIIGHELSSATSLMDWFLSLELHASVKGYTNHFWNGITTLDFARIVGGIIRTGSFEPGTIHLVPADQVSKYQLLKEFQEAFGRGDIFIEPHPHHSPINRTLSTVNPEKNSKLWSQAGYNEIPTVRKMVQKYALWAK